MSIVKAIVSKISFVEDSVERESFKLAMDINS